MNSHRRTAAVLFSLSILLFFSLSRSVTAQEKADSEKAKTAPLEQKLPTDPHLISGQFENGLRYYVRENKRPENRAALRLVVNAGSVLEDDDQLGLAHFVEPLMALKILPNMSWSNSWNPSGCGSAQV